jgi:hypothetical protein
MLEKCSYHLFSVRLLLFAFVARGVGLPHPTSVA